MEDGHPGPKLKEGPYHEALHIAAVPLVQVSGETRSGLRHRLVRELFAASLPGPADQCWLQVRAHGGYGLELLR